MEASCAPRARSEEEKVTKSKSLINRLFGCFNPSKDGSESELDTENDYVVMNHSVYKIPKPNQNPVQNSLPNSDSESNSDDQNIACQFDSEKKETMTRINREPRRSRTPPKSRMSVRQEEEEYERRIYEYIRMKTYEKMNPYKMNPNDFLNNLSSVFVDNIKDPIPKDPLNLPKIYNRYVNKPGFFQRNKGSKNRKPSYATISKKKRSQSKFGTVSRHVETEHKDGPFSYKEAIEADEPYSDAEEKVLIWKIVVVNEKDNDNK